jgi:hypothetical protein
MKNNKIMENLLAKDFEDEKGTNGLWDLSAEIALDIGLSLKEKGLIKNNGAIYAEDFGQDEIYETLKDLVKPFINKIKNNN